MTKSCICNNYSKTAHQTYRWTPTNLCLHKRACSYRDFPTWNFREISNREALWGGINLTRLGHGFSCLLLDDFRCLTAFWPQSRWKKAFHGLVVKLTVVESLIYGFWGKSLLFVIKFSLYISSTSSGWILLGIILQFLQKKSWEIRTCSLEKNQSMIAHSRNDYTYKENT